MLYYPYRQCPANHYSYFIQAGDTLYKIAQTHQVSLESIYMANPGIDPYYLRIGQHLCIPQTSPANCMEIMSAMQNDINMLRQDSSVQKIEDSNYGTSTRTTRVLKATNSEIQFDGAPVVFSGNYAGHYTAGQSYPYYSDAASGGQRGITVKDNFGIWHSFGYHAPLS